MGKHVDSPRYNIISTRVNDEEWDSLRKVATQLSISMSDMMRRAIKHLNVESGSVQLNRGA